MYSGYLVKGHPLPSSLWYTYNEIHVFTVAYYDYANLLEYSGSESLGIPNKSINQQDYSLPGKFLRDHSMLGFYHLPKKVLINKYFISYYMCPNLFLSHKQ